MTAPRRLRERLSRAAGPLMLLVVAALGLSAVFWGVFVADPGIIVFELDAGPLDHFAIGEVTPFEELDVYVVGLADGRIRAVDGIVRGDGCGVRWLPEDERARRVNPLQRPGVFVDPCSDAVWAITGDAVAGTRAPLRAFVVAVRPAEDGVQHVYVEVIGRAPGEAPDGD